MARDFYKNYLTIFLIIAGGIFFNDYFANDFLQNFVYKVAEKPGLFLTKKLPVFSRYTEGILKPMPFIKENSELKEENNILHSQLAELDKLRRENQFLRDELGVAKRLNHPLLLAQIFNIQKGALSSTVLINKGANEGVQKSLPVITSGNILIGLIDQVFDDTATVLLLDDPRLRISGRVQESGVIVETKGQLRNKINLNLISNSENVKQGNIILTSGLDGLPEALLVAKVTEIQTTNGAIFQTITASSFFDMTLGSNLFVILK